MGWVRGGGGAGLEKVGYPGYQPMSNVAANFGWTEDTDSHHLRKNSQ